MHLRPREYGATGHLKNNATVLKELGFQVGQYITRRKDKVVARIVDMGNDEVTIDVEEGPITGMAKVSLTSFVEKKEWKTMSKDPQVPQVLEDWQGVFTASENLDLKVHIAKSAIFQKLLDMEHQSHKVYQRLKLIVKPRGVWATEAFSTGKLTLVPTTLRIDVIHDGDDVKDPGHYVCLGKYKLMTFYLMPCFIMPSTKDDGRTTGFVSPYWSIRITKDNKDEANVERTGSFDSSDDNSSLKIHTIKNTKAINPGDELVMYVPKEEKVLDLEAIVPCSSEPEKKRQRIRTKTKEE